MTSFKLKSMLHIVSLIFCILLASHVTSGDNSRFEVEDSSGQACIILEANVSLQISYTNENGSADWKIIDSTKDNTVVSGNCADRTATMNVQFPNRVSWSLIFTIDAAADNRVALDRLVQFIPSKLFDDGKTGNDSVTFNDARKSFPSFANESFQCSEPEYAVYSQSSGQSPFNFSVSVIMETIHVQAFSVKNGTFSSPVLCESDKTTSETTSVTTLTTPKSTPVRDSLIKCESTGSCILFESRICFYIYYMQKQEADKKPRRTYTHICIPPNFKCKQDCLISKDEQSLKIKFFRKWSLDMVFNMLSDDKKSNSNALLGDTQRDMDYKISKMTLTYEIESKYFPGTTAKIGTVMTVSNNYTSFPHKRKEHDYYKCNAEADMKLSEDVLVKSEDMKIIAFNSGTNTTFSGDASECAADEDPHDEVRIIVGAVVGVGFIIVIIAGVIKIVKYRRLKNYESI